VKHCPRCDQDKPLEEYYKTSKRPNGLQSYCIPCQKVAVREKGARPRKQKTHPRVARAIRTTAGGRARKAGTR
jgi:transposase-like protein